MRARGGASKSMDTAPSRLWAPEMRRALELLGIGVLGGAIALFGARCFAAPVSPVASVQGAAGNVNPDAAVDPTNSELRLALERGTLEREMLAAEVELMRSVLEQLTQAQAGSGEAAATEDFAAAQSEAPRVPSGRMQFEAERLASLGMLEGEIEELRRQWDRAQLAKLELQDLATRNGALARPRYRRDVFRVEAELRSEVGDDGYDRLLYATAQLNRPVITQVLGGSAASHADLRAGDHLISYAGARVFKPAGLKLAIVMGMRGEQVRLEVERDGERISVVVPRGPLGVLMNAGTSPPR